MTIIFGESDGTEVEAVDFFLYFFFSLADVRDNSGGDSHAVRPN